MVERKPGGVPRESWIDRQIRESMERGEFDDLPGAGKPLPDLDRPRDDLWWVKRKLRDEGLSHLHPTLVARKERERALERIDTAESEAEVRRLVGDVNDLIRQAELAPGTGPAVAVAPIDLDAALRRWRDRPT